MPETFESGESTALPSPIPPLQDLHRVHDAGNELADLVCLDRNERVDPWPGWFLDKLRGALNGSLLSRYPVTDNLYKQLGEHLGLPQDQLLLTPGSDGAIKAIFHTYVRQGDAVLMLDPSYAMFKVYAQMFQARERLIPIDKTLEVDPQVLLDSVVPGVKLIFIANPNQPTGTLIEEDVLMAVAARAQQVGALMVVDEAYYPFSGKTVLPRVKEVPNLLVTRSFSKAGGLAGLRIGYVAGHREVIANLFKVRSTYDVNAMALLVASHLLEHPEVLDDHVRESIAGGQLLAERVRAMGLESISTHANFLLIRVGARCSPAWLVDRLRSRGFLVRGPYSAPCLEGCIRVSLAHPNIMEKFADCLQQVIETDIEAKGPRWNGSVDH